MFRLGSVGQSGLVGDGTRSGTDWCGLMWQAGFGLVRAGTVKEDFMSKKAQEKAQVIFRPADGCRLSQKTVDIIGPELLRFAQAFKVDIAQLTTKQVHDALLKDKRNPLWAHINIDPKKAMYEWVHEQVRQIIKNVRYEVVSFPDVRPQMLIEHMQDTSLRGDGGTGPARANAQVVHSLPAMEARAADGKINNVRWAVRNLKDWTTISKCPKYYSELADSLQEALERFDSVNDAHAKKAS